MNVKKGLDHLRKVDKKMVRVIDEFEAPVFTKEKNYFESLVRAIVYQQLSGKAASTIYGRFKDIYRGNAFPSPKMVLETDHITLRSVGLSNQKSSYIHNIAEAFEHNRIPEDLDASPDEEVMKMLTQIKGVGPWTAEMFLMFTLNRPDVFPATDLGVQKGFQIFHDLDDLPEPSFMIKKAKIWKPYRTLAAHYMWRLVEGPFEW